MVLLLLNQGSILDYLQGTSNEQIHEKTTYVSSHIALNSYFFI